MIVDNFASDIRAVRASIVRLANCCSPPKRDLTILAWWKEVSSEEDGH